MLTKEQIDLINRIEYNRDVLKNIRNSIALKRREMEKILQHIDDLKIEYMGPAL